MKLFIGADHRGFELKQQLIEWLVDWGHELEDMGAYEFTQDDDYTLYAEKVALMVRDNPGSLGVLLCGSGVGVDIVANKFDSVRAAIGKKPEQVEAGRADDDMNVLVVASDFTEFEEAKEMINKFLSTPFKGAKRHKRRLEQIRRIEENN